jgi:hypothetical protein
MDTLHMDVDDPNERPTLPAPLPPMLRAFDTQDELFFSTTATLPGATLPEPDELADWWIDQRRRTLVGWVAAAMALCAGLVVAGLLAAPV